jgi:hypothetical protein
MKIRISVSCAGTGRSPLLNCISTPHRQMGNSVESGSSNRSIFTLPLPATSFHGAHGNRSSIDIGDDRDTHNHDNQAAQNKPHPHGGARLAQCPWPPAQVERRFVFQCGSFDSCDSCNDLSRAMNRGPSQSSMSLSLTSCRAWRRPSASFSQTMTTDGAVATLRLLLMG